MSKATTVQVKTSELSGFLLNFALANAVSNEVTVYNDNKISANFNGKHYHKCFGATAEIAVALMESFRVYVEPPHTEHHMMAGDGGKRKGVWKAYDQWRATISFDVASRPKGPENLYIGGCYRAYADTPVEAVCRAVIASRLGDEVAIPAMYLKD